MKKVSMVKYVMKPVIATLLSLSTVFLMASGAQAALACYSCHGNGTTDAHPVDTAGGLASSYRNITTGAVKGNHSTHFGVTATGLNVCSKCHGANANTYASNHAKTNNFNIQINATVNYNKGAGNLTSFAQSTNPILGSCSNVNCHFEAMAATRTDTWGSPAYSTAGNCSACHTAPPVTILGHAKHGQYSSAANATAQFKFSTRTGCAKCHPDYVTTMKFSHATSVQHVGATVSMQLVEGTYNGARTNFLPSQSGSRVLGSCSSNYCHSPGTLSAGYAAPKLLPTWGVAVTCAGCHDSAASGTTLTTKHVRHTAGTVGNYSFGCVECHAATVSNSTTIKSVVYHVNKSVSVSFQNRSTAISGTYNGLNASSPSVAERAVSGAVPVTTYCNNLYCHSQGRSATDYASAAYKKMSTSSWNASLPPGTRYCSSCHGGDSTNNAIQRQLTSGGHRRHIGGTANARYNFTCDVCHHVTAANNTSLASTAKHVNFQKNVDIDTVNYGASATYSANLSLPGSAVGTCNNVYCHSNAQGTYFPPTWGKNSMTCTSCHGNAASDSLSLPHKSHVNNAVIGDIGTNLGCVDCHARTVSDNSTISNRLSHVNLMKDFSGVRAGGPSSYASGSKTCSATYCHSSGKKGKLRAGVEPVSRTWSSGVTLGCNACHGAATGAAAANTSVAGEPNYVSGKMGSYSANSHYKHVTASGTRITCNKCHAATVDAAGALISQATGGKHLSQLTNVSSGNYKYTAATRSCGNFVSGCHASSTPTWGGPALGCNGCHPIKSLTGAHRRHAFSFYSGTGRVGSVTAYSNMTANASPASGDTNASTLANYGYGCSVCHPLDGSASHANGTLNIVPYEAVAGIGTIKAKTTNTFSYSRSTQGTTVCSNVYCHSNGNGSFYNSPQWNATPTQTPSTRCSTCHGFAPTTNAHSNHTVGIHFDTISKNSTQNGLIATNGLVGVLAGHGDPNQSTTIGCYLCHNATTTATRNKYASACNSCHTADADNTGAIFITNLKNHASGSVNITFAAQSIKTKAQLRSAFTNSWSNYTGNATTNGWQRVGGYKVGTASYDQSRSVLNATATYTPASKSCANVVCHAGHQNLTPSWTNTAQGCSACHNEL